MLAPKFREVVLGSAQVRQVFKVTGAGTVAGCYVHRRQGHAQRSGAAVARQRGHPRRQGRFPQALQGRRREVAAGYECGMGFENYNDIKEGDVIECFQMEEIEQ